MATTGASQSNVNEYLAEKQNIADEELAAEWKQLEELHSKRFLNHFQQFYIKSIRCKSIVYIIVCVCRLWHQLTLKLETFVKHPQLNKDDNLIQLYNNFLSTFENK